MSTIDASRLVELGEAFRAAAEDKANAQEVVREIGEDLKQANKDLTAALGRYGKAKSELHAYLWEGADPWSDGAILTAEKKAEEA